MECYYLAAVNEDYLWPSATSWLIQYGCAYLYCNNFVKRNIFAIICITWQNCQNKKLKISQRIEYGSFCALAMGGSPPGIVGINSQGGPLRSQHLGNPWNPPLWKTTVKLKETGNKPNEMVEEHFSQIPPVKEGEGWSVSCSCLELKCLERFVAGTTRV